MDRRYRVSGQSAVRSMSSTPRCSSRFMIRAFFAYVLVFVALLYFNAASLFIDKITTVNHNAVTRTPSVLHSSAMVAVCSGGNCNDTAVTHMIPQRAADEYTDRFFWKATSVSSGFVRFEGGKENELVFRKNPNYIPSKCPTSIQRKMSDIRGTQTIFHPEIHLLINRDLFNKSEHGRLSTFYMPFGYKYRNFRYQDVRAALKLFPSKASIFQFPEDKLRPECLSCAVVCSGGILNGSRKGLEIDSHHMVFRVNNAIRRNHEQDVGNRTTHYFFFDRSLRYTNLTDVPKDKGLIYVFVPCRGNDYKYITSVVHGKEPKLNASANDVRILHPDFIRYVMKIWVNSPLKSFRPTTGTLMLLTSLHSGCDRVSVYGMGYNDKYTLYYYDDKYRRFRMDKHSHDTKSELAILKGLDRVGVVSWYKRDVAKFYTGKKNGTS